MTNQLSSLDIHFLIKELKILEGSRVDKVYNSGKEEIYIQLHKSSSGKNVLRIIIGKAMFVTETKTTDEIPSEFCMLLRRNLEGKFLVIIEQLEPERIVKLAFKSKEETRFLYLEFFGKGNLILCNQENNIIDALARQKFKDRIIVPKEKYSHPSMKYNFFALNEKEALDLFSGSNKDKLVTSLAVELGLGGIYSEKICLLSGIDKNSNPKEIKPSETKKITSSIKKIIEEGSYLNPEALFAGKKESPYNKKIDELKRIIGEQEISLGEMQIKEEEASKKGEAVYNNYQLINKILTEINKARDKYSWEEIRDKLKGHNIIREVDVKDKKITVEIP